MTGGPRIELADRETVVELVEGSSAVVKEHISRIKDGLRNIPWLTSDTIDWENGQKARMLALNPKLFELWWLEDYHTVKRGSVEPVTKELIGVHIANEVGCGSCLPYHAGAARSEGATDETIAIVREFEDRKNELPDDQRIAIEFGWKAVFEPADVTDEMVRELKAAGYTDAEIAELAASSFLAFRHAAINRALNLGQE